MAWDKRMTSGCWECTTHFLSPLFLWMYSLEFITVTKKAKQITARESTSMSLINWCLPISLHFPLPEPFSSTRIRVLGIYFASIQLLGAYVSESRLLLPLFSSTLHQSSYWTTRLPLSTLENPWSILSTGLQYHRCLPLPLSCPVCPLSPFPCFFPVDLLLFPVPVQGRVTQRQILCVP